MKPKVCPLTIKVKPAPLVQATLGQAAPEEVEGAYCIGTGCMWFVPISDSEGRVIDGQCGPALIPAGLSQIRTVLERAQALTTSIAAKPELDA